MSALAFLKLVLALLRRVPWQAWALLILLAGGWWYGHARYVAGQASVQALWDADRVAAKAIADQAIGEALGREAAARVNNARIEDAYQDKLRAAAADRESVYRLLIDARGQIRASASREATRATIADAAGEARRAAELRRLDERIARATADLRVEAGQNADQLDALIAVVVPQMAGTTN